MQAIGISRMIDDLGRIVIPKEVRRSLGLVAGSCVEMLPTEEGIIIKPYDPKISEKLLSLINEFDYIANGHPEYELLSQLRDIQRRLEKLGK